MSSGYLSHQLTALQINCECLWNGYHVLWKRVRELILWRSPIFLFLLDQSQDYWKHFYYYLFKGDVVHWIRKNLLESCHMNWEMKSIKIVLIKNGTPLGGAWLRTPPPNTLLPSNEATCVDCGRKDMRKICFSYRYLACQQWNVTSHKVFISTKHTSFFFNIKIFL